MLRLLSVVSSDTVETAFQVPVPRKGVTLPSNTAASGSGPAEGTRAVLLSYWDRYPLQTAQQVRNWAESSLGSDDGAPSNTMMPRASVATMQDSPLETWEETVSPQSAQGLGASGRPPRPLVPSANTSHNLSSHQAATESSSHQAPTSLGVPSEVSSGNASEGKGIDLPDEFKKRFLW